MGVKKAGRTPMSLTEILTGCCLKRFACLSSALLLTPATSGRKETENRGLVGSKLEKIARVLKEHKDKCDRSNSMFSVLVLVSTREIAKATVRIMEAEPILALFRKA